MNFIIHRTYWTLKQWRRIIYRRCVHFTCKWFSFSVIYILFRSVIPVNKSLFRSIILGEESSFISPFLLPKFIIIFPFNHNNYFCGFYSLYFDLSDPYVMIIFCRSEKISVKPDVQKIIITMDQISQNIKNKNHKSNYYD